MSPLFGPLLGRERSTLSPIGSYPTKRSFMLYPELLPYLDGMRKGDV